MNTIRVGTAGPEHKLSHSAQCWERLEEIRASFSSTSQPTTIRELIDQKATEKGDVPFLISPENGQLRSFQDLRSSARQFSAMLRREGLRPGDKVAFLLDNGLFAAELFLGAMYGGMVCVPLNVNAGLTQLVYMLDHCDAEVVFVSDAYASLVAGVMSQVNRVIRVRLAGPVEAGEEDSEPAIPSADEPALLMYSSGSTGRPKAAIHTHSGILAAGRNSVAAHQLTSADRSLLVLPLYHINAECVTLIPALLSGGSVVIPNRFSVSHFWDWIEEFGCTWTAVVPTIISQLLDWEDPRAGKRDQAFRRLRFLRSSSAPLAPALQREFIEKFQLLLIQAMGSSEAGNVFSNPQPPMENKIGSPGLPWGFEAKIVDGGGTELPPGESGEVLLRGPALMRGYYKEPEGTAAVLDSEGWLHTGDLAYRDADGYFFVVGRSKELIIKGGVNIAPRQIDDVLEAHPGVLEAAAIGVPDHHLGEDVIAYVVLRAGAEVDERELLAFCERRLGHFKTPARVHFATDLPKGPSGKVQRLRLREQVLAGGVLAAAAESSKPGADIGPALSPAAVQQIVGKCWSDVLGIEAIDPDANFFALGGHSLLAVQCLSRLRDMIPVVLSLSDFFDHGTIARQTALVVQQLQRSDAGTLLKRGSEDSSKPGPDPRSPIALRDRSLPCPLSPAQRRLWLTEQLNPGAPIFNESEAVRLTGDLNIAALEEAVQAVISRHEILRSTIQTINQEQVAVVKEDWHPRVKRIDLSSEAPSNRDARLERLLVEEPRQPFHLESEPGIRLTLVCMGSRQHVLILMMHHLVCDWASEGVFWRELSAIYGARRRGERVLLTPMPVQYGDYAAWHERQIQKANFAEDLAYWKQNLDGAPEVLDIPSDRPRPAVFSHRGARLRQRLNPSLTASIRTLSQRSQTTLFTIVAAGLNALLYRYSGIGDISLGIPISDREREEVRDLIGFFLHTHVLRTRMSGSTTFAELLSLVQKGTLGLYQHRAVPFEQVVAQVHPKRSSSHTPLFQVMFIWRDREQMLSHIGMEGLQIESVLAESQSSKFDLTLMATDGGDEIELEIEYSTDLFDRDRIERMFGHFAALMNVAVSQPSRTLAELPLLTDLEGEAFGALNRTAVEWPEPRTVDQMIEDQVRRSPDAVAVSFENTHLTYRELDERASQLAAYLGTLGVGPGTVVGICVERSAAMIVGLLGILKSGAAYLPLDPAYPADRLAFVVQDAQPVVILTDEQAKEKLTAFAGQLTDVKPFLELQPHKQWKRSLAAARSLDALAYVLYTSGSTGKPKGVQIPHRALTNLLRSMKREPGFTADDRLLSITTLSFDIAGLEILLPLIAGGQVVIAASEVVNDGQHLASLIAESRATVMQATPATWRMLLDAGWTGSSQLRILCGGEAWSSDLAAALLPKCKSLWNMYGPTETTIWSSAAQIHPGKAVRIGRPIANTTFHVLDADRELAPIGIPGELYIGGDGVALGYWNRPELTAERFVPDPFSGQPGALMFRTGDLVRRTPEGELEFLHRIDHQVKVRGYRIELGEVEAALERHPGIQQAVVVVLGEDPAARTLAAYMIPADPSQVPAVPEIRQTLSRLLPAYMIPAGLTIVDSFPLTPNGKIDRKALGRMAPSAAPSANAGSSFYCTRLELQLAQMWEQILRQPIRNHTDSFFDLGGHSLLAVRLISEVNRLFDTRLTIPAFLDNPTVLGMAALLRQNRAAIWKPTLIPLLPGRRPGTIVFLSAGVGLCRLGQALDHGAAVYAAVVPFTVTASGGARLKGSDVAPTLPEIASVYVDLIEGALDSGPCVLVGHSFTGLLAFEVAHQLAAKGQPVDMIALLDAWTGNASWRWKLRSFSFGRAFSSARRILNRLLRSSKESTLRHRDRGTDLSYQSFDEMSGEVFRELVRTALKGYRLVPLRSRAVLFRARDGHRAHLHAIDPWLGWKGLFTDGIEVVETAGDHSTMLLRENLPPFARRLLEALNTVTMPERAVCNAEPEVSQVALK